MSRFSGRCTCVRRLMGGEVSAAKSGAFSRAIPPSLFMHGGSARIILFDSRAHGSVG